MNMFWSRKLSSQCGSAAVLHILRAATVAAVVSSCSTSPPRVVLAQAEEPPTQPLVLLLDPDFAAQIKNYAWTAYRNLEDKGPYQELLKEEGQLVIPHVTISWTDVNDEERLLSLAVTLPTSATQFKANLHTLRIPRRPGPDDYKEGFVHDVTTSDTGSPATNTRCTRISGTQYSCSF